MLWCAMRGMILLFYFSFVLLRASNLWAGECDSAAWRVQVRDQQITQQACVTGIEVMPDQAILPATYNVKGLGNRTGLAQDFRAMVNLGIPVFAFQEVRVGSEAENFPQELIQLFPDGEWFSCFRALNQESANAWEGQAIVSSLPISNCRLIPLQFNGRKQRAALQAEIHFHSTPIWIVNTDHEVKLFELGPSDRKRQLDSLVEYFTSDQNIPVVLLGDFNTTGSMNPFGLSSAEEIEQTYEILARVDFKPLMGIPSGAVTFKTWGNQLDHILLRGFREARWQRFDSAIGSDHYPIYTEVELLR